MRDKNKIIAGHLKGNFSDDDTLEGKVSDFLKSILSRCKIFVDVGANVGYYTQLAFKYMKDDSMIYSFEPDEILFSYLEEKYVANKKILLSPLAISNAIGNEKFFVSDKVSSGSFLQIYPTHYEVEVETTTIDKLLEECTDSEIIIKIDVEGGEMKCIEGAISTLQHLRPLVIIEIHDGFLQKIGLTRYDVIAFIYKFSYTSLQLDGQHVLFVPKEKLEYKILF